MKADSLRRVWFSILFGLIGCAMASAADFATEMVEATFKLFSPSSTSTCFLVRRGAPDQALYLVTAAHVLDHAKGDTMILVLREHRADGSYQRRDHKVTVRREGKPLWICDTTNDAAVLRLPEPLPVAVAALPVSALADEARCTAAGLHICSLVFVLTYPTRFEVNETGFPTARQGIIASPLFPPLKQHPTFYADFTTFDGDSGGPVFVRGVEGHPLVVGMVLAYVRHDEQVNLEYEERMIHHPLGLGTVLHAQFVRDLIEETAAKK